MSDPVEINHIFMNMISNSITGTGVVTAHIEALDGSVRVSNHARCRPGEGNTYSITLPVNAEGE